jgi:hypothetical protein
LWIKDCPGCQESRGHPAWAAHLDTHTAQEEGVVDENCPIYSCSGTKGYKHCGHCPDIPCTIWIKLKDPTVTVEQHLKWIDERVHRLKNE